MTMSAPSKLGRNYYLQVQTPVGTTITIQPPFTLEMDITRHTLSSSNVCQIRLYNLAEKTRNLIRFNVYDGTLFNTINLAAGYGTNLATVFSGNVSRAWSVREGVNFITQIECYDGGFAFVNGEISINFPAGTPLQNVIVYLMSNLPNVDFGACSEFPGVLQRASTFHGNPQQLLTDLTGGAFFVDSGKAYCLKNNDFNAGYPVVLVNASTGLLNTPVLEETMGRFEMLFEPRLNVGGAVLLDSDTNSLLNGMYVINGVKHRGIISPVVSGSLTTIGEFFYSQVPNPIVPIAGIAVG